MTDTTIEDLAEASWESDWYKDMTQISLCQACFCMTHTIKGKCGKCGQPKDPHTPLTVRKSRTTQMPTEAKLNTLSDVSHKDSISPTVDKWESQGCCETT